MSHYGALDAGETSAATANASPEQIKIESVVIHACCDEDKCSKPADTVALEPNGGIMCSLSWVGFALILAWFSVIWNTGEGVAGIYIGAAHVQLSVLANAGQSACEVVSAILVLIRLREEYGVFDRPRLSQADLVARERIGIRWMGILFCALAVSVLAGCIYRFYSKEGPEDTLPGMIVSAVAGFAMIILYFCKRAASRQLNSKTLMEDANCSMYCFKLSVSVVIGSILGYYQNDISDRCHARFCDLWWVDAMLAAALSLLIFRDGVKSIRVSYDESFDGGCGCCAGDKPQDNKNTALLGSCETSNVSGGGCCGTKPSSCDTSAKSNCAESGQSSCCESTAQKSSTCASGNKTSSCCSSSAESVCASKQQAAAAPALKSCCASGQKCAGTEGQPAAAQDDDSDPDIYADD